MPNQKSSDKQRDTQKGHSTCNIKNKSLNKSINTKDVENDESGITVVSPLLQNDNVEEYFGETRWNKIFKRSYRFYLPLEQTKMEQYESVDTYEPRTTIYKDHLESRSQEPRWFIWVFVFGLGITSSIIAILVISILHVLNSIRYEILGFGLRGFSFEDSNRYVSNTSTKNSNFDIVSMFEGNSVGLYGIEPRHLMKGYLMWISFSLVMSLISTFLCLIASDSVGSGLPEVIAYLNGVNHPILDNLWIFIVKMCSIIFSVASGACTGHYSVLILSGAMLGAQVLQRKSYFRCDCINIIECFRNPRDRRIIIVSGAAAGVASAFSVSIGGLMVVLELISTMFPVRFALYVFVTSLVSSLTMQVYFSFFSFFSPRDRSLFLWGELISEVVQSFVSSVSFEYLVHMNIFYLFPAIVIGLLCGLLANLFIKLSQLALMWRLSLRRWRKGKILSYMLPLFLTLLYVSVNYWITVAFGSGSGSPLAFTSDNKKKNNGETNNLSLHLPLLKEEGANNKLFPFSNNFESNKKSGPCVVNIPLTVVAARNISVIGYYGANGFFCPKPTSLNNNNNSNEGVRQEQQRISVLHSYASLAFANADSSVQMLLSWRTTEMFGEVELITFLFVYFVGAALFFGFSLGGDTLLPGLVTGALIGRLIGQVVQHIAVFVFGTNAAATWADPGCFALIGAGSFLGGTTGLTFSICTILMECTGDMQHILPLMVGITIAKKTSELFTQNINAIFLEMQSVPMLDFENDVHKYPMFDARHVMTRNVVSLETVCTVGHLLEVLRSTRHSAFPIKSVRNNNTYKGIIMRQQLEIVLWHLYFTPCPLTCAYDIGKKVEARLFRDKLLGTLPSLEERLWLRIDLSPYIDHSGFCVLENTTLPRTYTMFRTLGLRHLTVVNSENLIVGIITRKDLVTYKILDAIFAANEARHCLLMNTEPSKSENTLIHRNSFNFGGDAEKPYLPNMNDKSLPNIMRKINDDYQFFCSGEWIVVRRYDESYLDENFEVKGFLTHPDASQMAPFLFLTNF